MPGIEGPTGHANLEPLADGDAQSAASRELEYVLGDGSTERTAVWDFRLHEAVGEHHPAGGLADGDGDGLRGCN